jgi:FeS assembly SUF system protein
MNNKTLKEKITDVIKTVYDPEIPVNIYEIGLIYEIQIDENNEVLVLMTLTSPTCPVADNLLKEVKEKVADVKGVKKATVQLTFDPPWDMDMMSDAAKLELGML